MGYMEAILSEFKLEIIKLWKVESDTLFIGMKLAGPVLLGSYQ